APRRRAQIPEKRDAQFQIQRPASRCGRQKRNVSNYIARFQHGLTLWRVSRQEMKICNRNSPLALWPMHMDSRFECGQRHVHVGWIGGDAMVARAENSETAVYAGD